MTAARATEARQIPLEVQCASGVPIEIGAAGKHVHGAESPPSLSMLAYSGGPMDLGFSTLYVDLEGMEMPKDERMPILRQHRGEMVVAQSRKVHVHSNALQVQAEFMPTPHAREVQECAAAGFRWQASIAFKLAKGSLQWLDEPEHKAQVNGREVTGPCAIARKSRLNEASVVPLGADGATSATVTAFAEPQELPRRNKQMPDANPNAPEKKGASLIDLKAAFPKDREFALDQFEAGATIAEAKAAYSDVLAARLEAKEKEVEEARKASPQAAARAPRPPVAIGGSAPGHTASARDQWEQLVAAGVARGLSRDDARREVMIEHPDIHAGYLSEVNRREWAPIR